MTGWLAGDVVRLDDGSVWGMVVNGDYWVLLGDRENAYLDDDATTYSSAIDRRSPTLIARGGQPVPAGQDQNAAISTDDAKALLTASGFVVLREKSYRQAQERQRIAEALLAAEIERRESSERWTREMICTDNRRLYDRLTFVYGVARAHGATVEELSGS